MTVRLVNDATALISMRESDFDAYSAYGEVVDNSIQANSSFVRIHVETILSEGKSNYEAIKEIAFGDNGDGMNKDVLQRCLQLGYSTRYNDRKGIGRFGVGMTLAAINQCQRIEVYSKTKNGNWLWTYIDITEMLADLSSNTAIAEPIKKEIPPNYQHLVGEQKGTLVIWCKYDRQPQSAKTMLPKMHVWLGRTYRYFMWDDNLEVKVNGQSVKAIDPLYIRWEKTDFPNDPPGEEFKTINFDWPVPEELQQDHGVSDSEVSIKMSLVHESLRPMRGAGNKQQVKDRHIPDNEGISILRNKREVFYGHVPYWPKRPGFEEIDRWWGCEVRFNAILDHSFSVKNIKRGAVPTTKLKKVLCDYITPTQNTCLERVRELWAQNQHRKKQEELEESRKLYETGHENAEKVAKDTATDISLIDKDKNIDAEAEELVDRIFREESKEQKAALVAKWKSQPFTIHETNWKGAEFFETNHIGGSDVLNYNMRHPFFEKIYEIIEKLEVNTDKYESALRLKQLIDLLLISYSKAEAKFEGDTEIRVEDYVEQIRMDWGSYLKRYLTTWLKEIDE